MTGLKNTEMSKQALLCMQRHAWEQGVAMQAFYELGDRDTVILLAKEAAYRAVEDGRCAILSDYNNVTDPCCVGEALKWAWEQTGDKDLKHALDALTDWALNKAPRSANGIVYHVMNEPSIRADSMYMLPPFLAAIGRHEEAMKQMRGYEFALKDETGLYSHMWNEEKRIFTRKAHWGVGNGWVLAAFARMIPLMPEHASELISKAKTLIDALLPFMTDGCFHDVVDDDNTFIELNLSQILAYTLLRGMRQGWLEGYTDTVKILRNAYLARVDEYGIIRQTCGAPFFDKPGTAPECQAFLLMAEHEWELANI